MSCIQCEHINLYNFAQCKAFPKGIPGQIAIGVFIHDKHFKGDNNILFKKRKKDAILELAEKLGLKIPE